MSQHGSDLDDLPSTQIGHELQPLADKTAHAPDPEDIYPRPPLKRFPLRRFYKRTITLIIAPVAITAYYLWIWRALLSREFKGLKYSNQNEAWIFYTWFIIGIFGQNLSRYGLQGTEAAMLHEQSWQVDNAMVLLMHSGSTWSGPSGWMKVFLLLLKRKRIAQRLWFVLASLSILAFAGMPLSGLTMEISDGFVRSPDPPHVVGRTWQDFERRSDLEKHGASLWRAGGALRVPGAGIAYTPPHTPRDRSYLKEFPNTFFYGQGPHEDRIAEIFFGPQASTLIAGKAWGLRFGVNCSIVKSVAEFTILNKKSSLFGNGEAASTPYIALRTEDLDNIYVFNSSGPWHSTKSKSNTWVYGVIGSSWRGGYGEYSPETDILEYALWQVKLDYKFENFEFNGTIDTPIAGLGRLFVKENNGTFSFNGTLPALKDASQGDMVYPDPWWVPYTIHFSSAPIGVRCLSKSALGAANVNGYTFTSFNESPPYLDSVAKTRTSRLGHIAAKTLIAPHLDILRAINAPAPVGDMGLGDLESYPQFVQARTLLSAVLRAQSVDALQLMYDGIDNVSDAYINVNLTSSKEGKVLEHGVVTPFVVGILYIIWATACAFLACSYGFRRRWADSLDGYSFFRFGADLSDDIRGQSDFSSVESFDRCESLWGLPGLVGDFRPRMDIGHVSLVTSENLAKKSKLYN